MKLIFIVAVGFLFSSCGKQPGEAVDARTGSQTGESGTPAATPTNSNMGACLFQKGKTQFCMQYYNWVGIQTENALQKACASANVNADSENDQDTDSDSTQSTQKITYQTQCPSENLIGICDIENLSSTTTKLHSAMFYYKETGMDEKKLAQYQSSIEMSCGYLNNNSTYKTSFKKSL